MRTRFAAILAAGAMFFTAIAPAAASAATLSQQPQQIKNLTFDTTAPNGGFTDNRAIVMPGEDPPTAYWGAVSGIPGASGKSWWCAGTSYPSAAPLAFATTYPVGTRGISVLRVPELANYYSSTASFSYLMPSRGGADDYSFVVMRQAMDASQNPIGPTVSDPYVPLTSTWKQRSYDLASDPSMSLSRKPGEISFQYFDYNEFPGAVGVPPQAPNGQGAAIDNLIIAGYKYGPIRSLTAARVGGNVNLAWSRPAMSKLTSADDTRTIAYRVWRSTDTAPTNWTELPGDGGTALTFTDTQPTGLAAHYFVQAWDTATGGSWGDPGGSSVAMAGIPDTTRPVTTISTLPSSWTNATVSFSLTATDEWWNILTTKYQIDGGAWQTYTKGSQVAISSEGKHTVNYYSFDQAAPPNTETAKSATVRIDKTPPMTSPQVKIGTGNTAIVNLSAVDALSGVAATHFTVDLGAPQTGSSVPIAGAGSHNVTYWSVDSAGNAEAPKTITVDPSIPAIPAGESRVQGPSRIDTAVDASKKAFPVAGSVSAAVVAYGYGWTDALPGTALAAAVHGPLLLTHNTSLDSQTQTELQRLGVKTVYVVGNLSNVNAAVRTALSKVPGVTSVVSVTGASSDVYTAARDTAYQVKVKRGNWTGGPVFISRSDIFADSLAASSLAANQKAPIILVPGPTGSQALPPASLQALQDINPSKIVICGSTMAVTAAMQTAIHNWFPSVPIDRRDGSSLGTSRTRYDTARDLITFGTTTLNANPDGIYIARGDDPADALAGGVLAGASYDGIWRPLMITAPTSFSPAAAGFMDTHTSIKWVRVMGSSQAVNDTCYAQIKTHLH